MAGFGVLIKFRFHYIHLSSGTGRSWSALAFRFAPLLSPPMPATAETQTLWARRSEQIVNQQQVTAKYIIKDAFKITGRGLVLAGHIDEGEIYLGDFIEFNAFDKRRKRKITGIEGIRNANPDKTNTGLLIKCEDETEIDELRTWRPDNEVGLISKE